MLILRLLLFFVFSSVFVVLIYRWVPVPVTPLMVKRCIQQKSAGEPVKLEKDWVSFDELSPNLQLAVVAAEDANFLEHEGFDFAAIRKAMKYNATHKKKRGASTISQQTAKNVFLWDGRSWIRKGLEVWFTFLIETFWSKERIMTVYLNVIEMGPGVYGAEAAAQHWYHKPQHKLSNREAAGIASILPSPLKWNPVKPDAKVLRKQNRILGFMRRAGWKLDYSEEKDADMTEEK